MIGLDTSVVLRLFVGEPRDQAEMARRRLEEGTAGLPSAAVSDLVVGETYFALRHHYAVPHAAPTRPSRPATHSYKTAVARGAILPP